MGANKTSGNIITEGTLIAKALTDGYVPYHSSDSGGLVNSEVFWDSVNSRVGIGTAAPVARLDVSSNISISAVQPHLILNDTTPEISPYLAVCIKRGGFVYGSASGEITRPR
jgi:hypothetical protein